MDNNQESGLRKDVEKLWTEIRTLTGGTIANRLALGQRFRELQDKYSDRNSGGHRLTSAHGTFEEEIRKRGYRPRTVRSWIADFEAALAGEPLGSAKRKSQRLRNKSATVSPVSAFAALLPYRAMHAAYREAAKLFHPDHGGDEQKMQRLNELWQQVKAQYETQET